MFELSCVACDHHVAVPEKHAGRRIRCPGCKGVVAVPRLGGPDEAAVGGSDEAADGAPSNRISFPRDGRGFEISIDPDSLTASLVVAQVELPPPNEDGTPAPVEAPTLIVTPRQLAAEMPKAGIKSGVRRTAIKRAFMTLLEADAATVGKSTIIARGRPPGPSTQGHVEYAVDVTGKAIYRVEDVEEGDGAGVDFKNATRIETVNPDDLLATITPGVLGKEGLGLNGKPIGAEALKPLGIAPGNGVDVDHTGNVYVATIAGRPLLIDGVLSVVPIYDIDGDVDISTGHIRFNGHVTVKGSVQDDYNIFCKSLEVMGTVGAATIECEERAVFRGGVNGQGRGTIRTGGKIAARYLNRSDVLANGGITVERGITNSTVKTLGTIRAERIIGGNTYAMAGIQVNHLGSDLGVVTYMEAGTDFRITILDEVIKAGEDIRELLEPYALHFGGKARYDSEETPEGEDDEEGELDEEEEEDTSVFAAYEEAEDLIEKRDEMVEELLEEAIVMVNVDVRMHSDVVVSDGGRQREFNATRAGPITIAIDPETSVFEIEPKRPLKKPKKM